MTFRRLGTDRVRREQHAADELIGLCARLPLALNIMAARAASQPTRPLAELAGHLRSGHRRLDMLDAGDPVTHMRAVFLVMPASQRRGRPHVPVEAAPAPLRQDVDGAAGLDIE